MWFGISIFSIFICEAYVKSMLNTIELEKESLAKVFLFKVFFPLVLFKMVCGIQEENENKFGLLFLVFSYHDQKRR